VSHVTLNGISQVTDAVENLYVHLLCIHTPSSVTCVHIFCPLCNLGFFFSVLSVPYKVFVSQSSMRHVTCKYLFPMSGSSFHSLNCVILLNLKSNSFMTCGFLLSHM
jgi:hypothetical protein